MTRRPLLFAISSIAALQFSAATLTAAQAVVPHAPRVFIEGFRANDSLSLQAAVAIRHALASRVDSSALRVMSTQEIDAQRASGAPDDFGHAWRWVDIREVGRAYRVQAIIDVVVVRSARGITLTASRIQPARSGAVVALAPVRRTTLAAAVSALVERLVADTVFRIPVNSTAPDT